MQEFNDDTIYILDSYGLIYRCYFAFISRPLTNSRGENISALFGFFRNLHAVFTHYKPRYIAAAFDSRTPTFRHEMYDEYKATRAKRPTICTPRFRGSKTFSHLSAFRSCSATATKPTISSRRLRQRRRQAGARAVSFRAIKI